MKAIILVAGRGSRLGILTKNRPKCLAKVNETAILTNALQILNELNFKECILVIGYKGNVIIDEIGYHYGNIKITYIYNELYSVSNTSYSLWLALQKIKLEKEMFIFEGDVFFEKQLIKLFLKDQHPDATIIDGYSHLYDGSFVEVDDQQNVIDWVHKSSRPEGFIIEDKFKTVNIHKFSDSFIKSMILPYLGTHEFSQNKTAPLEYIMQYLVKDRQANIFGFLSAGCKWYEVDTAEELHIANSIFKIK